MTRRTPSAHRIAGLIAALAVVLLARPALAELSYVGSSTIGENIMPEAAKAFHARTGIAFRGIETQGSGKGLDLVLSGAAPLAGVSRGLTRVEKQQRIQFQIIGYDAVAVFVHPTNPIGALSKRELKAIYTGQTTNWKQVGGPDASIIAITQIWGGKRAQMIEFQDRVMDGADYRPDRREVDRQVDQVQALTAERNGITAVSLAFARPGIKAVAIEGFAAGAHHIRSGAYVLSRPLILVAPAHPTREVKRFLEFMLSSEGQQIVARHFVPLR